jgi:hypothetical protein
MSAVAAGAVGAGVQLPTQDRRDSLRHPRRHGVCRSHTPPYPSRPVLPKTMFSIVEERVRGVFSIVEEGVRVNLFKQIQTH